MRDPLKDEFQHLLTQLGECVSAAEVKGTLPPGSLYRLRANTDVPLSSVVQDWQEIPDPAPPTLKSWILENHTDDSGYCSVCEEQFPCNTVKKAEELG